MLNTPRSTNPYSLEDRCLKVSSGLAVNLTAKAVVYPELPDKVIEFKYDVNGLRTQKKVSVGGTAITTDYILHGKLVTEMKQGNNVLHFFYDNQSRPAMVKFGNALYTYIHNLQGDIVGIVDSNGNKVVEYKYDAWGKPLSIDGSLKTSLGKLNPFRYRGYVYDEETGLYYLRSRYYNPEQLRFINADAILNIGLLSANLYGYCVNSPVCKSDPYGKSWLSTALHSVDSFLRKHIDTAKISAFLLNMKKDKKGVYHADYNCWQQFFGYNNLYDWAFNLGTSMLAKKFDFSSGGKDYIFWMWKGDYLSLGAGAELGIYTGGEPHWRVDKSLAMNMSMSLSWKGKNIASWSERHWWLTSFNPEYQNVNASDLTVTFSVTFDSAQMYYDFKGSTDEWIYDDDTYTASYTY